MPEQSEVDEDRRIYGDDVPTIGHYVPPEEDAPPPRHKMITEEPDEIPSDDVIAEPPQPKDWWYSFLGLFPGVKERRYMQHLEELIEAQEHLLRDLASTTQLTFAVVNMKGGAAKTALSVNLASVIAEVTRQTTVVVDSNNSGGQSAKRLGIRREDTAQLRQVFGSMEFFKRYASSIAKFPVSRHGVKVIASDEVKLRSGQVLERDDFEAVFKAVKDNANIVVLDTGNDSLGDPCMAAVNMADVLVFTASVLHSATGDEVQGCADTMQTYRINGFEGKVNGQSVVVVSGGANDKLDNFARFFNHAGPITHIPEDPIVKQTESVNLTLVQRETYLALLETASAIFELVSNSGQSTAQQEREASS